jgi:hypothetical protein
MCIREALPGCSIKLHDDNSMASMYDLKIVYPDGRTGAVKVTAAADPSRTGQWQEIRKHSLICQDTDLIGGWLVHLLTPARIRDLGKEPVNLLRDASFGLGSPCGPPCRD